MCVHVYMCARSSIGAYWHDGSFIRRCLEPSPRRTLGPDNDRVRAWRVVGQRLQLGHGRGQSWTRMEKGVPKKEPNRDHREPPSDDPGLLAVGEVVESDPGGLRMESTVCGLTLGLPHRRHKFRAGSGPVAYAAPCCSRTLKWQTSGQCAATITPQEKGE